MDAERIPLRYWQPAVGFAPGGGFGIALDHPNLFQVGAAVRPAIGRTRGRAGALNDSGASVKAARRVGEEPLTPSSASPPGRAVARLRSPPSRRARRSCAGRQGERAPAIRAVDVVAVKRIVQPAETAAPTRPSATASSRSSAEGSVSRHPELAGDALRTVRLAAFFLSAGGVHSYLRWSRRG